MGMIMIMAKETAVAKARAKAKESRGSQVPMHTSANRSTRSRKTDDDLFCDSINGNPTMITRGLVLVGHVQGTLRWRHTYNPLTLKIHGPNNATHSVAPDLVLRACTATHVQFETRDEFKVVDDLHVGLDWPELDRNRNCRIHRLFYGHDPHLIYSEAKTWRGMACHGIALH